MLRAWLTRPSNALNSSLGGLNSCEAVFRTACFLGAWVCLFLPNGSFAQDVEVYFFKEARPLTVKPGKLAVTSVQRGGRTVSANVLQSRLDGVTTRSAGPGTWVVAEDADSLDTPEAVLDRVEQMKKDRSVDFVSPVFEDARGGDLIFTEELLVGFKGWVPVSRHQQILQSAGAGMIRDSGWSSMPGTYRCLPGFKSALDVLELANELAQMPEIAFAEPDAIFSGTMELTPNDPGYSQSWGLHNTGQSGGTADMDMDAPEAWDITTGSSNILVAVLDTGVQQNHPDLNQIPGTDVTSDGPGDGGPVNSCDRHGTPVAGCVSALINNSLGAVGIAPGVRTVSIRTFISNGSCNGTWSSQASWTVDALEWAETNGVRVSNNSNKYGFQSSTIAAKYASTRANGMVHFASAGNDSSSSVTYPASLPDVQAVAAVNRNGSLASFSNYGSDLFISAPGQAIYTTDRTGSPGYSSGDYTTIQGTSFASPYAAGVAALVLSQQPGLTAAEVEQILQDTAMDLGAAGYDTTYGYGLVNAEAALLAVSELPEIEIEGNGVEIPDGSAAFSTADYTDFGQVQVGQTLTLNYQILNSGGTNLFLTNAPSVEIIGTHTGDFAVTSFPVTNLPPTDFTSFGVAFTPLTSGVRQITVRIPNTDSEEDPYTFAARGTGVTNALPELDLFGKGAEIEDGSTTASTLNHTDYGSLVVTSSLTRTFTMTNSGDAVLSLGGAQRVALSGSDPGDFSVTAQPPSTLAAGATQSFDIVFSPSDVGVRSTLVTLQNNDPNEDPYTFVIQGTATPQPSPDIGITLGGDEIFSGEISDAVTSPLIDLGDPARSVTHEPAPNGGVVNLNVFGNTRFASRSPTNAWIFALTASSGGRLEGAFDLIWAYGNIDSTNTVSLDYSFDNGVTWTSIVQSVAVTNRSELWVSDAQVSGSDIYPSSPVARWRITVDANTNIMDITDNFFALRNTPFTYYLNDTLDSNDVFTTAAGDDANLGFFPSTPKATLANLLDEIDVEGEDTIVFDTGSYTLNPGVTMQLSDGGDVGELVLVRGSSDPAGSILNGSGTLLTLAAPHVIVSNLTFQGALAVSSADVILDELVMDGAGITLNSSGSRVEDSLLLGGNIALNGSDNLAQRVEVANGRVTIAGSGNALVNSLVYGDSGEASVLLNGALTSVLTNNTLVGQRTQVKLTGASSAVLQNNIIVADGTDNFAIRKVSGAVNSDYNNLVARNGAWIGSDNGFWEHLVYWQRESGQDANSLSHEPLFVDEAGDDYRLQSVNEGAPDHSPAIDAGNPLSLFGNEPLPNGNRINLGAYGNTEVAAESRLDKSVLMATANDGGVLRGTNVTLRWLGSNLGGETVTLQYSADGGSTWTNIATGLTGSAGSTIWDTTGFQQSLDASLRVVLDSNTNVVDEIDTGISLRDTPLDFYVNDTNTAGDVFTSAPGAPGNDGQATNTPKDTIQGILDTYDVEGGDTIWVDTGEYTVTEPVEWIWSNGGGELGSNVVLRGAGRVSRIQGVGLTTNQAVFLVHGDAVTLRELEISGPGVGVHWATNIDAVVERSWAVSNRVGVLSSGSEDGIVQNTLFLENSDAGVRVQDSSGIAVRNNTFVQNAGSSVQFINSSAGVVENNIFDVGSNAVAYAGQTGSIFIDYNVFDLELGGEFADGYSVLRDWQLAFNHDFRSAITNAGFFDAGADDFHLLSSQGRYDPGLEAFVTNDLVIAWGVDKGNPDQDESLEPEENGDRVNIGAFGGTEFASKGLSPTQEILEVRSLNSPFVIDETNSIQPLIWHALNVPTNLTVDVEFSGDGGDTWVTISNVNAYSEFIIWQPTPEFNTFNGLWRVIGETNSTVYADTNAALGEIFFGEFKITSVSNAPSGLQKIQWTGAWDETYKIEFTKPSNPFVWTNAPTGLGPDQDALFVAPIGGDLFYEDIESGTNEVRLYRVIQNP